LGSAVGPRLDLRPARERCAMGVGRPLAVRRLGVGTARNKWRKYGGCAACTCVVLVLSGCPEAPGKMPYSRKH